MWLLRRFFYNLGKIGLYLVPFMLGGMIVFLFYYFNFIAPLEKGSKKTVYYAIPTNATFETIAKELEQKQIIRNWWSIYFLSKLQADEAKPRKIIAGEYALSPSMTPKEILKELLSGKLVSHRVEVQPGSTLVDIAGEVSRIDLAAKQAVEKEFRSPRIMGRMSVPAYIPEGYVTPGTYEFSKPTTPAKIVLQLIGEGKKRLEAQHPDWKARSAKLGYRPYEMLILASLIEKEAPKEKDKAVLSSLYHTRLQLGMPLESEAALSYVPPDAPARSPSASKDAPGPYNTFLNMGLPQTPICSPGGQSLKAALFPKNTEELYYLKTERGDLLFAKTIKEFKKLKHTHGSSAPASNTEGGKSISPEDLQMILGE